MLTGQVWGAASVGPSPSRRTRKRPPLPSRSKTWAGEASYEAGWDNYSMAEGLRLRAACSRAAWSIRSGRPRRAVQASAATAAVA